MTAGRETLEALIVRWRAVHAGYPGSCCHDVCGDELEAALNTAAAEGEAPQPSEVNIAGVYMDRSIADFQRACAVHIGEEQRKAAPDTALIALLCDAVRCSRELAVMAVKDEKR